jgi:hypothetical protein
LHGLVRFVPASAPGSVDQSHGGIANELSTADRFHFAREYVNRGIAGSFLQKSLTTEDTEVLGSGFPL